MVSALKLSREQIAKIVGGDPEAIKQFEKLMATVNANTDAINTVGTPENDAIPSSAGANSEIAALRETLERGPAMSDLSALETRVQALELEPPPVQPIISVGGWGSYRDTAGSQALVGGVRTLWTNNAGTVNETYKPRDRASFWSTNKLRGALGESLVIKIQCTFTPTSAAAKLLDIEVNIGGAIGALESLTLSLPKGSGVPQNISWTFLAYTLDTFVANGGEIYFTADGPGNITNKLLIISRNSKPPAPGI